MLTHRRYSVLFAALSGLAAFLIFALRGEAPIASVFLLVSSCAFFGLAAGSLRHVTEPVRLARTAIPQRFASVGSPAGSSLALLFVDVDGLESDRRSFQILARAVETVARPTDIVVRWAGDQLAIFAPDTGRAEAFAIANRLQRAVEAFSESRVTVSIGVAATELHGWLPPSSLIDTASDALEHAKSAGHNRSVLSVAGI